MSHPLTTTLVQFDRKWHDPAANRDHVDRMLAGADLSATHLIVLPEMFTTGFTMASAQVAEPMSGPTVKWMTDCARRYDAVVTGTVAVKADGALFNRLVWARPDGGIQHYDKRHLFRMADEHTAYRPGTTRPVFELNGWRIRPIICYDLRFPVWCRVRANDYDAMLCPANWPDPRHHAWLNLLTARAIENQACMIANNRVGTDAHDKHYLGNSMIIDAKGHTVCDAGTQEAVVTATLSREELQRFRDKFPVHADADEFQ
ncbi:MAG: amidohydrolase, partial [Woeseiaceae bacterium]